MAVFALSVGPALLGPIITLVASAALYAVYRYCCSETVKQEERDLPDLVRILRRRVRQNLEMLRRGDFGWRRIARGRTRIDLLPLLPEQGERGQGLMGRLEERFPALVAEMAIADERLGRLSRIADRLGEELEAPVKAECRERPLGAMRDNEENWMLLLRQLINNERFFEGLGRRYQDYWREHKSLYRRVLQEHGGATLEQMQSLRQQLIEQYRAIASELEGARHRLAA